MTKADIINRVSEELGIDRRTVGLVIESFMKCVASRASEELMELQESPGNY